VKATMVNKLSGWRGDARVFKMEPAYEGHEYVIVSAADAPFSGPETYIFPTDNAVNDEPSSWGELPGSKRGTLSHYEVLSDLGYEVVWG
jgi:hypothetical protein